MLYEIYHIYINVLKYKAGIIKYKSFLHPKHNNYCTKIDDGCFKHIVINNNRIEFDACPTWLP